MCPGAKKTDKNSAFTCHCAICYVVDVYGDNKNTAPDGALGGNVTTVVNFGQHHAAVRHATVATYRASVEGYAAQGGKVGAPLPPPRLWIDSFPFPVRNDKYVHDFRDWRTTHRVRLFNAVAEEELARHGVGQPGSAFAGVVQVHDMLEPLSDWSFDRAHYGSVPSALNAMVDVVVGALCRGPPRE